MCRGEGGVTAEIDLDGGRKPAERPVAVAAVTEERRLRQVHLRGDALQPRVIRLAAGGGTDRGRISAKRHVSEGVNLEQPQFRSPGPCPLCRRATASR